MSVRVAVAQFAPGDDVALNIEALRRAAREAVSWGASLLLAPEYSAYFHPEFGEHWNETAQRLDGEVVAAWATIAVEHGITLVAGMHEEAASDGAPHARFHNTAVAIGPDGAVVATYRKLHLYDAFGVTESDWVAPGEIGEPAVFTVDGVTVGLQTCYDLRFPEVTRRIVDAGAELVLVPAEWVRGPRKEDHWRTLLAARAIENTIYVAAADHAPPVGVGHSQVIDPMGIVIADLGERAEAVAVASVDRERIAEVRRVNPALSLRRFTVVER